MPEKFSNYQVPQPNLDETRANYAVFHKRLSDASSGDECLAVVRDWDATLRGVKEWASLTYIRFEQDTQNEAYQAAKEALDAVMPKFTDLDTEMKKALLASPFRKELEAALTSQLFARWECDAKSFSAEIQDDLAAEAKLGSEHTTLTAGGEVEFRGETLNLSELLKFSGDADRATREAACRANSVWFADNAPALDRIYDDQVKLRHSMARKLGYDNFTQVGYQRMSRIGYGPEEVATFRNEVRDRVVPLAAALGERQAEMLGLPGLMFWDSEVRSANGNPKPLGDHDWMIDRATEMFDEMGHGLDVFFREMKQREVMDLKARKGKAGGGFCDYLHQFEFPFIFGNFNGTRGDVDVFTHEVGHAFQSYSSRKQPFSDIVWPTTEACEIHSMGLEFLTWPHMEKFYGDAAEELRRVHLASSIQFLPYGVAVDHFQHLVYDRPEATPDERNAMWQELEKTYMPWINYGDLPAESNGRRWQQKRHLYHSPFYYIDYCLALTGAMQFWSKSRTDSETALRSYADLCQLGGSLNYNGLLESAGLQSPFQKGCLDQVMENAAGYLG